MTDLVASVLLLFCVWSQYGVGKFCFHTFFHTFPNQFHFISQAAWTGMHMELFYGSSNSNLTRKPTLQKRQHWTWSQDKYQIPHIISSNLNYSFNDLKTENKTNVAQPKTRKNFIFILTH